MQFLLCSSSWGRHATRSAHFSSSTHTLIWNFLINHIFQALVHIPRCRQHTAYGHVPYPFPRCRTGSAHLKLVPSTAQGTHYSTMDSWASLDPRPNPQRRVWGETMPRGVLSARMLPSVLMRERTSLQPTSVQVRLMTGSKYTKNVEILKIRVVPDHSRWRSKRGKLFAEFRNRGIPARHFWVKLFPRPFLAGGVWGPGYSWAGRTALVSLDPRPNPRGRVWGENLAWKCLEHWNATVNADEGTNITSANQRSSLINCRKQIYSKT